MVLQEISTYLIISTAVGFTLYRFYHNFFPRKKKSNKVTCSGGCAGCGLAK